MTEEIKQKAQEHREYHNCYLSTAIGTTDTKLVLNRSSNMCTILYGSMYHVYSKPRKSYLVHYFFKTLTHIYVSHLSHRASWIRRYM